jgi:carbon-monoxide dehydrogenase large subunit
VAAATLGVELADVTVVSGDTTACPYTGYGTGGSRAAAIGGGALMRAATRLRDKALRIGAHLLEADPSDVTMEGGRIYVQGTPSRFVTLAEVGDAAYRRLLGRLPDGEVPTLEEREVFDPDNGACSYGCTAVMVEVDRETGRTRVLDYLIADDCGTMINPTIVDGQLHGGAAQGIGEALYEELVYGDDGQLLTGSFMDYLLPTASEIPPMSTLHMETPAPHLPGGMKGVGEAGVIGAPAAVANAIDDALRDLGVVITTLPVTPSRLRALIEAAAEPGGTQ